MNPIGGQTEQMDCIVAEIGSFPKEKKKPFEWKLEHTEACTVFDCESPGAEHISGQTGRDGETVTCPPENMETDE
ncbi:hypothetical protein EYF80_012452 [Liparis tanakae]|uniref:Uncharacterized protein n=1 Tax=Liparis tanakae TaxID=230148 RepID=A0A4Z2IHM2_9TELE|nr:hypothetical protein EYF80_012452 [Liparis tanakae]